MWIFEVRFVVFIHMINYMKIYIFIKIHVISYGSILPSISSICCPCGQFHFQYSISSMLSKFIHVVHPCNQWPLCGQFDVWATIQQFGRNMIYTYKFPPILSTHYHCHLMNIFPRREKAKWYMTNTTFVRIAILCAFFKYMSK
jgi:hypothetical protein